jgi:hypothetical protein
MVADYSATKKTEKEIVYTKYPHTYTLAMFQFLSKTIIKDVSMLDELKALFPKSKALYVTKNILEEIDSLIDNIEEIECLDQAKHNRALELMAAIILAEKCE